MPFPPYLWLYTSKVARATTNADQVVPQATFFVLDLLNLPVLY